MAGQVTSRRAEESAFAPQTINGEPRRMLVVDDSFALRERLAQAFQDRGFQVEAAEHYEEALRVAAEFVPDFAVVDLRMPGRSGLDLVRELKVCAPECEVLVLSGFGSITTAIDAVRLGAVNFLPKPADADDILAAFRRGAAEPLESPPTDHEVPTLARTEWEHIHRVMADCNGNLSEAARRLGIHRRSLQRKLQKRAPD